jgi:hypothetical protein
LIVNSLVSKAVENDKKNENKGVNVHNERMDLHKTPSLNLEILNLVNDDASMIFITLNSYSSNSERGQRWEIFLRQYSQQI